MSPMPKAFETWTVLSHGPTVKHTANLWSVQGSMPNPRIRRVMAVARRTDGRLVIHNGIALEEAAMRELETLGEPAFLLVPNGFHRQDAKIWKVRYPKITVLCPEAATKRVADVVRPDGSYLDYPADERVAITHLEGVKRREGVMIVRDEGTSLVFNDMLANLPKTGGPIGFIMGPTGRTSLPRVMRWLFVSDKRALSADLEAKNAPDLQRLIVSHGDVVESGAAEALRAVGAELRA
jgi:hypothetical protein